MGTIPQYSDPSIGYKRRLLNSDRLGGSKAHKLAINLQVSPMLSLMNVLLEVEDEGAFALSNFAGKSSATPLHCNSHTGSEGYHL